MSNPKCGHCPLLAEERECPGQKNPRVCVRADPTSELHDQGILRKIANFATAVVQHVAAGMPEASPEVKVARLAICQGCDEFNAGSCRLCGCGLEVKAGWADQECPIGKWAIAV